MTAHTLSSGGRPPGPPALPPVASRAVRHRLGPAAQVPFGEGRTFDVDGEQVAVFRLRSGRWYGHLALLSGAGGRPCPKPLSRPDQSIALNQSPEL